jgi:hypothetical protein
VDLSYGIHGGFAKKKYRFTEFLGLEGDIPTNCAADADYIPAAKP